MNFLLVFLGGGLGAATRHGVNILSMRLWGVGFPIGTLLVNVVGSLIMGMLVEHFALRSGISTSARLFLTTGVLGGFTTFSAFSLEAVLLYQRGQSGAAALYVLASTVLSIGALIAGMSLVRTLAS